MPKNKALDAGDTLDRFMAEWRGQRPDLDFDYLATIGRILRVSAHLRESMDGWLAPFGLTWEMFDLLASLQRAGGKTGLRPTDLYEACMLSSGAMTNRVDRAEKLDYAVRQPDPDDGRATRIALTRRGRALTEKAMTEHALRASAIAQRLTAKEQAQLAGLLRKLLLSFEKMPAATPRKSASNGRRAALA
ncbi:MAG: MarR family transcriptional regulator [Pseudolabrys sp.]|nr:MarR family transcriptional regulator [Pseudolabrys sp.]